MCRPLDDLLVYVVNPIDSCLRGEWGPLAGWSSQSTRTESRRTWARQLQTWKMKLVETQPRLKCTRNRTSEYDSLPPERALKIFSLLSKSMLILSDICRARLWMRVGSARCKTTMELGSSRAARSSSLMIILLTTLWTVARGNSNMSVSTSRLHAKERKKVLILWTFQEHETAADFWRLQARNYRIARAPQSKNKNFSCSSIAHEWHLCNWRIESQVVGQEEKYSGQ